MQRRRGNDILLVPTLFQSKNGVTPDISSFGFGVAYAFFSSYVAYQKKFFSSHVDMALSWEKTQKYMEGCTLWILLKESNQRTFNVVEQFYQAIRSNFSV